jgi:hypothetical protein
MDWFLKLYGLIFNLYNYKIKFKILPFYFKQLNPNFLIMNSLLLLLKLKIKYFKK